jgi:hypothetical protein
LLNEIHLATPFPAQFSVSFKGGILVRPAQMTVIPDLVIHFAPVTIGVVYSGFGTVEVMQVARTTHPNHRV